jgi:hypothetical protein
MTLDKVLPCNSHVDDGCFANLVRRVCNPAAATAIVVDLGWVVIDAAAELTGGGKGGRAQQWEGGEGASKEANKSLLFLSSMSTATAVELTATESRTAVGSTRQ